MVSPLQRERKNAVFEAEFTDEMNASLTARINQTDHL